MRLSEDIKIQANAKRILHMTYMRNEAV